ncbi:MAG: biotin/lipoate A/B protein ligase family protein [Candidatus Cryosericum sp.]
MSGIGAPYENMSIDEALFNSACRSGVPVLRFYGWSPATVSLGFAQRSSESLNFLEMERRHIAWLRRPTGGRAVLHDMEVTYSISVPESDALYGKGLEESYEWLCMPIVTALQSLGVSAQLSPHGSSGFLSASCFTTPGTTDILAHGRKIVGSAQMRTREGFLQHGSIVLKNDLEKNFAVIRSGQTSPEDAMRRAAHLMTSVSDETHRPVSFSEMSFALVQAFSQLDGIHIVDDTLTEQEMLDASLITQLKYGCEDWNALR